MFAMGMGTTFDNWRAQGALALIASKSWLAAPFDAARDLMRDFRIYADGEMSDMDHSAALADMTQRGRWAMSGYPTLRPTHRACASWMATNFRPADVADFAAPWPAFVIQVPTGMLALATEEGAPVEVAAVSASQIDGKWSYTIATNPVLRVSGRRDGIVVWAFGVPAEQLAGAEMPRTPEDWSVLNAITRTDLDTRTETLARRLILGVCAYYSQTDRLKEHKIKCKGTSGNRRDRDTLPDYSCWEMRSEIGIDVVRAVKEWARTGNGKSPTVQCMVAGHGRWQAYGPKRALRKWIQVAPYWRGPEDAPVVSHAGKTTTEGE